MKKLLALLIVLGVFACSVNVIGCGGATTSAKKADSAASDPKKDAKP